MGFYNVAGETVAAMWLCHAAKHGPERSHDCSQAIKTKCCSPKIFAQKAVQPAA